MFGRTSKFMTAALVGCSLIACTAAFAADIKPAVVYDLGGKFDKSFNEGVFNGATKFTKDSGVPFRDLEIQNDAQREQVLRKFAKDGYSPIMTVGSGALAVLQSAGELAWGVALIAAACRLWRPNLHPLALLSLGAVFSVLHRLIV
ncbi:hypothetical protein [Roseiarcus sp.]|uniref:hypothetical protein n=1 Tax=Roseiarcus sp. TaxID=1969460 RepID=UPI003F985131